MATSPGTSKQSNMVGFFRRLKFVEMLQSRNFRLYWLTNALFFMGFQIQEAMRQWLVVQLTTSRSLLGLAGFLQGIVIVIVSPTGGVLADRVPKRHILLLARVLFFFIASTMATLLFTDNMQLSFVLLEALAFGAVMAFSQPASQSYIYDLVGREKLGSAIAFTSTGMSLASLTGPGLGGILIAIAGIGWVYVVSSGSYILGFVILAMIPILGSPPIRDRGSVIAEFMDGLRIVRNNKTMRWVLLAGCYPLFGAAVIAMRPVYAQEILHVGPIGYGLMFTMFGIGAVIGSIILASLGLPKRVGFLPPIGGMIWSTVMIVYSLSRSYPLTLGCEVVIGAVSSFWPPSLIMACQIAVPPEARSRALGLLFMTMQCMLVGFLVTGFLADAIGDTLALAIPGLLGVPVMGLILMLGRPLRALGTVNSVTPSHNYG